MDSSPRAWLDSLGWTAIKLGLERMEALAAALGSPQRELRFIHVAGTNGKGSTCAFIEAGARSVGLNTGFYSSPHLVDVRERIRIGGGKIPEPEFLEHLDNIRSAAARAGIAPTYFEVLTVASLLAFRDRGVELVAWETGLGGRLDATNIVRPVACAITPIGFDHVRLLGGTLAEIAGEKAGILKSDVPVVIAPQDLEVMEVLLRRAKEVGSPVIPMTPDAIAARAPLRRGPAGPHQEMNAAVAHCALELAGVSLTMSAFNRAAERVRWPARFEQIGSWLLDGAHNEQGAAVLVRAWQSAFPGLRTTVIFSNAADKNTPAVVRQLAAIAERFLVVPINNERGSEACALATSIAEAAPGIPLTVHNGLAAAMQSRSEGPGEGPPWLITGSLYLCGEALTFLAAEPEY